jgi:hypothetical protein
MITQELTIPVEILNDKRLDATNKLIMAQLKSLSTARNGIHISDALLGEITGMRASAVNRRMSFLENEGFIQKRIVTKNRKVIGRVVTILDNPTTLVPVEEGTIPRRNTATRKLKPNEVVEAVIKNEKEKIQTSTYEGKSISSTSINNNLLNNTRIPDIKKDTIAPVSTPSHGGMSRYEYQKILIGTALVELQDKSSLGERILHYVSPEGLNNLKMVVNEDEYNDLRPIIIRILENEKGLR